jgi:hypothetical protein
LNGLDIFKESEKGISFFGKGSAFFVIAGSEIFKVFFIGTGSGSDFLGVFDGVFGGIKVNLFVGFLGVFEKHFPSFLGL